ncbi:MAG: hypothetical protein ABMA64_06865 [Myxococcota bacterium]
MSVLISLAGCFGSDPVAPPPAPPPEPVRPPLTTPGPLPLRPEAPGDPAATIGADNCDDLADGGPVAGPDCVTQRITCGQTIAGHTRGGAAAFDTKFYEKQYCTPALTNHSSGDERVYLLSLPDGDRHASIWLDTPCADLDLAAMRVTDAEKCPTVDSAIKQCEMSIQPGQRRERVDIVSQTPSDWLIVVEGKNDAEGAFALTVQCGDGIR